MSDWIRPSVKQPPVNTLVLAWTVTGYDLVVRYPRGGGYWGQGGGGFVEAQVYAWMPLPELPDLSEEGR